MFAFTRRCHGFVSSYGARHRYTKRFCQGTGRTKFTSLDRGVTRGAGLGTKSHVITGGVKGNLTLFIVNRGSVRRKVGVLNTRVSSPHVSLGRMPLCRSARVTLLSARCCKNIGGCR